jgi:CRISP-associated protein Cas1
VTTLLNTLFVAAESARVHKDHETLVVSVDQQVRARVPLLHVAGVVVFSPAFITPEAMHALTEQGAGVSYLSATGEFLARVEGLPGGNVLVRRAQFRAADSSSASLELARSMVGGKVFNSRVVLQRAAREGSGERSERLAEVVGELALRLREVERAESVDALRGVEGLAARQYWEVFDLLIKRQRLEEIPDGFMFAGRTRRPPKDRVNALLSFGYAMLMHDCVTACAACGLDPAVGFLHEDRPGRLSLALDLMEELRAPVVDRFTLAVINREQLRPDDLTQDPTGGWSLTKQGRKTWFVAWQEAKRETVTHPFLDQEVPWQRIPAIQALLLARQLRGDVDKYPPFLLK